jgi:small subunit ribosomal protein S3
MGNRSRWQVIKLGLNIAGSKNDLCSSWFCQKQNMRLTLMQDYLIRDVISRFVAKDEVLRYSMDRIDISRSVGDTIFIKIFTCKPGKFVGTDSANIKLLEKMICKRLIDAELSVNPKINVSLTESFKPDLNANLIAQKIVELMVNRANYTQYIRRLLKYNAKSVNGIRIEVGGRLNGATIARDESYECGSVRLSSFDRNISQATLAANTVKGVCGVRVTVDSIVGFGGKLNG